MATGQKDEKRFLLERGDKNLSAAPQKNQAEREDLRAKTRSGEREGKRKKDKNQNLQTDKCIFQVPVQPYICVLCATPLLI